MSLKFRKSAVEQNVSGNLRHIFFFRLTGHLHHWAPAEKGLGILVEEKSAMSGQDALTTQKAYHALGCIPSSVGTGRGRGFCPSAPLC